MIESFTLNEPLLSLPLPRHEVRQLSMKTLCCSIAACSELSSCEIKSMDRYTTIRVGFRHRFLLFQIQVPDSIIIWARLDRRWPIDASVVEVIKGVAANDQVSFGRLLQEHALRIWAGPGSGRPWALARRSTGTKGKFVQLLSFAQA